jgi:isopenicillin N synthase-like dioxygenase
MSAIGRQMLAAAGGIGFFYIRNHGIPASLIDAVFAVSARFFGEPLARKQEVAVNAGHRGYIQIGEAKMASRAKPDLKESFIWGLDQPGPDGIPPNRWPDFLPDMPDVLSNFFAVGSQVGWSLLRAFAAGMNIASDTFVCTNDRPISRGSILYYPPQPPDMGADQFGVSSHTDYGCLTLLYQDSTGGLEVQGSGGTWLTAHPIEGTFVVNVGDLLARWTNDRFRSTPHRVVNRSGRARFSTALFIDPNADTRIEPVVQTGDVARYASVTCAAHLRSRLDASFAYRQKAESVRGRTCRLSIKRRIGSSVSIRTHITTARRCSGPWPSATLSLAWRSTGLTGEWSRRAVASRYAVASSIWPCVLHGWTGRRSITR